ncbi:MAG: YciI family protein [Rubrivivax sp.]
MAYLLLIQEPVEQRAERGEAEGRELYQRMLDYTESLRARGVLMASSSLEHVRAGQSLRIRDGQRRVVDGPFTESKEMVGGFFLVDVAGRAQALALAAECPAAAWATVEVRETGPCYLSN